MSNRKQDKAKKARHAVDMSVALPDDPPGWSKPSPEDTETQQYTCAPPEGDPTQDRITVRMVTDRQTHELVEFAITHDTCDRGQWRHVTVADSAHDDEAHVHRYGRREGERVGEPETLTSIRSQADVLSGYDLAYAYVVENWVENKRRWHDV